MKFAIIGDWLYSQYQEAFARGLRDNNHETVKFSTAELFNGVLGKYQNALPLIPGPALINLNRELLRFVQIVSPSHVLCWRCPHILPKTIQQINALGVVTISYNNDDPFGPSVHGNVPWHHHYLWYWYIRSLKYYQYNFFYRKINSEEAKAWGAKHTSVLLPYFIPWRDRPVQLSESEAQRFGCDVAFVGHYESGERVAHLKVLVASKLKVNLYGGRYWTPKVLSDLYDYFAPIVPVEGDDYAKALCGAKICLAFLSKLNRDTYTRRCFEIPACGRAMLAERTVDLMKMFKEDEEACFFSSSEELVTKAKWLIENPEIRERIAQAGMRRVWTDGHDVKSRVKQMLNLIS